LAKRRSAERRSAERRLAELRSAERRSAERRSAERRSAERRSAERRLAELRLAELRSAELRLAKRRSAELRLAELRLAKRRSAELRLAELRLAIIFFRSKDNFESNLKSKSKSNLDTLSPFFNLSKNCLDVSLVFGILFHLILFAVSLMAGSVTLQLLFVEAYYLLATIRANPFENFCVIHTHRVG
jgi:hypothetical protein